MNISNAAGERSISTDAIQHQTHTRTHPHSDTFIIHWPGIKYIRKCSEFITLYSSWLNHIWDACECACARVFSPCSLCDVSNFIQTGIWNAFTSGSVSPGFMSGIFYTAEWMREVGILGGGGEVEISSLRFVFFCKCFGRLKSCMLLLLFEFLLCFIYQ